MTIFRGGSLYTGQRRKWEEEKWEETEENERTRSV